MNDEDVQQLSPRIRYLQFFVNNACRPFTLVYQMSFCGFKYSLNNFGLLRRLLNQVDQGKLKKLTVLEVIIIYRLILRTYLRVSNWRRVIFNRGINDIQSIFLFRLIFRQIGLTY